MTKLRCTPENAERFRLWIRERGGLAVWQAADFSGRSWTTPAKREDGQPSERPHWAAAHTPSRTITDPADVVVETLKEVRRFRVAVRRSSNGLAFKLTDAASRKLRAAVDRAGPGATYVFDYSTQEACVMVPDVVEPLSGVEQRA